MCKINVKKSILEIVEKNNLEILKIDLVIGMFTSKVQEDKVDVELPDIDALIKENTSDEFIERKINDILGIKEK